MSRKLYGWIGLAVLLVLLVAINTASLQALKGARADLTQDKLYSLSEGTRNILSRIDEPVTLQFYYSRGVARGVPVIEGYAQVVQELLEQYAAISGGKVRLEVVEPEPFSPEEDEAVRAGLRGVPVNAAGDNLFFGLVGRNSIDEVEVIPFFTTQREKYLEYDLTQMVHRLANPQQSVVGVVSSLPVLGDQMGFNVLRDQREIEQPWVVMSSLQRLHEVRQVDPAAGPIDDEISLLLLIHPKDLSDQALHAIDQFALSGKPILAFVDPFAEQDLPAFNPQNPMDRLRANRSSSLGPLLDAWGVEYDLSQVAGDRELAVNVQYQSQRGVQNADYVAWLAFTPDDIESDDFVLAELDRLNLLTPGAFSAKEGATTTFTPLLQTTEKSKLIPSTDFNFGLEPTQLLKDFKDSGERMTLAARIMGPAKSAFPDGAPGAAEEGAEPAPHVAEGEINVILVGDSDFLTDRLWVQVQQFAGQRLIMPFASNGDFLSNAVDNLLGSTDMAKVRSRGTFARPFDVVDELEQQAQDRYREREEALQAELEATQTRINELQRDRKGASAFTLSPEQQAELDNLREKITETRKELRGVQRQLRGEVEGLGKRLALINMFAMPALLIAAAVGSWGLRLSRRRRRA